MNTLTRTLSLVALAGAAALPPLSAQAGPVPASGESAGESPIEWFTQSRFGLFIHWGLYAIPGGTWKGELYRRDVHLQHEKRIPIAEYARLAGQFDPVDFDADAIVRLAGDAGMKYIVFTTKHHDGFAMFDSPSSPYNSVAMSPARRDYVKELAEACGKHGLKLGLYYSLGRDWHDPDVPTNWPTPGGRSNTWDFPDEAGKNLSRYVERKVKPQIRELLTQYGPIACLWFDTPELINRAQSRELRQLIRSLQPDCLVNARIGHGFGDYAISELHIPEGKDTRPWEVCLTMNASWAYVAQDRNWKSADTLIRHLVDIASKGGNLLLNIGPTGTGAVPAPSVERLHEIGAWLRTNGEAIYGTQATVFGDEFAGTPVENTSGVDAMGQETTDKKNNPAKKKSHGPHIARGWRCTSRPGVVYIHLLDWPGAELTLGQFPGRAVRATWLGDSSRTALPLAQDSAGVSVRLPEAAKKATVPVLKIEYKP